ncbi:MAG: hypothetical protein AAFZ87_02635 [Planctomycetota bacterium]
MPAPDPRRTRAFLVAGAVSAAVAVVLVARSGAGSERASVEAGPDPVRTTVELERPTKVRLDDIDPTAPEPAPAETDVAAQEGVAPSLVVRVAGLATDAEAAMITAHVESFVHSGDGRPRADRIDAEIAGDELRFDGFPPDHAATVVVSYEGAPRGSELRFAVDGPRGDSAVAVRAFDLAAVRAAENAATEVLRAIAEAQAKCVASVALDVDGDGVGEFSALTRLVEGGALDAFDLGAPQASEHGVFFQRGDYAFRAFLPASSSAPFSAIGEAASAGEGPDVDGAEQVWCAYAWPVRSTDLPRRAFFVGHARTVHACANSGTAPYEGLRGPLPDAALSRPGDLGAPPAAVGERAADGRLWIPLGR